MAKSDAQRSADEVKAVTALETATDKIRDAAELLQDSNLQWGDEIVKELHQIADAVEGFVHRIYEDC